MRREASALLTVVRDRKVQKIDVTLGEKEASKVASVGPSEGETSSELGLEVAEVPSSIWQKLHLKEKQGVLVGKVDPDGVGGKMGLQRGDVILEVDSKDITGVSDFNAAVTNAKANKVIRLKVQRRNQPALYMASSLG